MEKIIVDKKNYDKFAFKGPLAVESYCDVNQLNDEIKKIIDDMYLQRKKYTDIQKLMIKERDELVSKISNVINELGIDNFTLYDDGDIEYNY
ncbi:MAG: hypothetical protein IJ105_00125 [Bacilli bacterium]|nr:hypothetical protein [Bacilli bacterium]